MSHYDDCEQNPCTCRHRYTVVQIRHDGSTMTWGWSHAADGGRVGACVRKHPETARLQVRDRVDGGLAFEAIKP